MAAPDDTAWTGTNSDWATPTAWSNGVPQSGTSVAGFNGTGSYAATLSAAESYAVDSVWLSDYNATLLIDGTLETSNGLVVSSGTLVDAGSIAGPLTVSSFMERLGGTSQTLPASLALEGGVLSVADPNGEPVTLTNAAGASFAAYGEIGDVLSPALTPVSTVTLVNAGTMAVNGGQYQQLDIATDALVNSGQLAAGNGYLVINGAQFTNTASGTVSAVGGYVELEQGFANAGLVTVAGGGLDLGLSGGVGQASWSNSGVIAASGANVSIGGNERLADLLSLRLVNDQITLDGTLQNAGGSLGNNLGELAGATADYATIVGGTVDLAALPVTLYAATLDDVTITGGLTLATGLLTLTGGSVVEAGNGPILVAGTSGSRPELVISLSPGAVFDQPIDVTAGTATVEGAYTLAGTLSASGDGAALALMGAAPGVAQAEWVNAGSLIVTNGATLMLGGDERLSDLGAYDLNGATVLLTGTLENAGHTLNGGVLAGATLTTGGTIKGGVLDVAAQGLVLGQTPYSGAVYAEGGVLAGVEVINGLTMAQGAVTLAAGSAVYADAGHTLGTILVAGTVGTDGYGNPVTYQPYLEIDSNGTVAQPVDVLQGDASLFGDFTLTGELAASGSGATLSLDPYGPGSFVNAGTISIANGATLLLGGDETLADLGNVVDNGGVVVIVGTLENAGHTLGAAASLLVGATLAGTIAGGTLDGAALGLSYGDNAVLNDVTVVNGLTIGGGNVTLANGGEVDANAGTPGTIVVNGTLNTVSGPFGTYTTQADPQLLIEAAAGQVVGQSVDVLHGGATISGPDTTLTGTLSADGSSTIQLDSGYYAAGSGTFINQGVVSLTNGGILALGGDETAADYGSIVNSGGEIIITGTLENAGHTLGAASTVLTGATLDGTIVGGALDAGGLGLNFWDNGYNGFNAVLSDVTLINGFTLSSGVVTLAGNDPVYADAGTTRGSLVVDGPYYGTTLEVAPDFGATISQAIDLLQGEALLSGDFTLGSDITASGSGATLALDSNNYYGNNAGRFVNDGAITLENGATLLLGGDESLADYGSIVNDGGTVVITGTLENAGQTLSGADTLLSGATLAGTLMGGTLIGGGADAAGLRYGYGGAGVLDNVAVLNGLALTGTYGSDSVTLAGATEIYGTDTSSAGTLTLGNGARYQSYNDTAFIGENSFSNVVDLAGGNFDPLGVVTFTGVLSGYGNIGQYNGTLVNAGTIAALPDMIDYGGGVLSVGLASLDNTGLVTVSPTASLEINSGVSNTGTFLAQSGTLDFEGSLVNAGLISASNGVLALGGYYYGYNNGFSSNNGTFDNTGTILAGNSTVYLGGSESLGGLGSISLTGSDLILSGTLDAAGATLDGTGASALLDHATLNNGTLENGTVSLSALALTLGSGANFDNMALLGGLTLTSGEVTLAHGSTVYSDAGATLGTIVVNEPGSLNTTALLIVQPQGTLDQPIEVLGGVAVAEGGFTLTSDLAVTGANAALGLSGETLNNYITQASWINLATISVAAGGVLVLGGDETAADFGTIDNVGGTVFFAGTLENTGSLLGAGGVLAGDVLAGGKIEGGTLDQAALGLTIGRAPNFVYSMPGGFGTESNLDNVEILGNLTVSAGQLLLSGSTSFAPSGTAGVPTIFASGDGSVIVSLASTLFSTDVSLSSAFVDFQLPYNSTVADTLAAGATIGGTGYVQGDTLVNQGVIEAAGGQLTVEMASLVNAGTVMALAGANVQFDPYYESPTLTGVFIAESSGDITFNQSQATLNGALIVGSNAQAGNGYYDGSFTAAGTVSLGGGTLGFEVFTLAAGASLAGSGLIEGGGSYYYYYGQSGTFDNEGALTASGGLLTILDTVTGAGTLSVAAGATLELATIASNDVALEGGNATLVLDAPALYSGTIGNFLGADAIILNGIAADSVTYANGQATIGGVTLALSGNFTPGELTAIATSPTQTVLSLAAQAGDVSLTAPGSLSALPGQVEAVSGISVTDPVDTSVTVQVDAGHGVLSANPESGALVQGGGTNELILIGSVASVNAELATLVYRAPAGQPTDTLVVYATAPSGEASTLVDVAINQPPSFALPAALLLEPGAAVPLAGVALEKADAQPGEMFTVTVGDRFDTLSGAAEGNGTLIGSGSALVTLIGTLADVNAELANLSVSGAVSDALTLAANDGQGGSMVAYLAVDLNQPPVINGPATFTATLDEPVGNLGISVTDNYAAAAGGTLSVTLQAGNGTLSDNGTSGSALTLSGTVTDLNNALAGLTYTANQQGGALDPISILARDANGGTATATIEALDLGQPPTFVAPSDILLQANQPGAASGISLSKFEDIPGESYTVYIDAGADTIFAAAAGGGAVHGSGSDFVTLTGTLAAVNAELAGLTLSGSASGTLGLAAVDSDAASAATANVAIDVNVPAVVHAPGSVLVLGGQSDSALGVSVSDPYAAATGEQLTVTVQDATGTLSASGQGITGNNSAVLSFSGNLNQINQELAGLTYTATANPLVPDAIAISVVDPSGGTGSAAIVVTPPAPPTLTAPTLVAISPDIESAIDGISVQGGGNEPGGTPITIDLGAQAGVFGLKITDHVSVSGNYSNDLQLVGSAGAINTALSSLVYLGATQSTNLSVDGEPLVDEFQISATEGGATATDLIPVSAPTISGTSLVARPVMVLATDQSPMSAAFLQWDQGDAAYVGTLYVDLPGYYGPTPQTPPVSLLLTGFDSILPVPLVSTYTGEGPSLMSSLGTLEPFAPVVGSWESSYGQAPAISLGNVGEGSPVQFTITSTDIGAKQPDTITYTIKSESGGVLLPDRRLTIVFNKPGPVSISSPSSSSSSSSNGGGGGGGGGGGHGGGATGDVHLKTFDGLFYDFQAAGEFVLAKSTAPGDSFQVQIRLQPWHNSATVSVMTEVAAAVGNNRVTFDLTRNNLVWVNGAAVSLHDGQRYELGAGVLEQLSGSSWEIIWDSGEKLIVSDAGSYLNVSTQLAKHAAPGSVEGLLGNNNGNPANDLVLPDGTVLKQPVSFAQLYTTFADAWRVSQATSLLDYGPGQTTATFTDRSFPSDSVSLGNIPQNLYQNALALVTAAGITNPAQQQAAIEDFLLTGDTSFITTQAQNNHSQVATILPTPPNPVSVTGLGIGADATSQIQSASGTTAVEFIIYNTGTAAGAETVGYTVIAPGGNFFGADNFAGGVLPSGVVTLSPGESSVALTIDVLGSVGAAGVETLGVALNPASTTEVILASTAYTAVESNAPVRGTDGLVAFEALGGAATVSGSGNSFTLDLGTIAEGASRNVALGLVNAAASGADTLSGLLSVSGGSQFSFSSGLGEVVNLSPGALDDLSLHVSSGTAGPISEQLTFVASESNGSGYSALLGTYVLTIEADVALGPLVHAPAQEIVPYGAAGTLGGISLSLPGSTLTGTAVSVVLGDVSGKLAIGNAGGATLTGNDSTQLTLTGDLGSVNAALATLQFTGTSGDQLTLSAGVAGGATVSQTIGIIAQAPQISAANFFGSENSPTGVPGISITDPYAQAEGAMVTLRVSDSSGILGAAGAGVSGNGSASLTLSGTAAEINQELSTLEYTRTASGTAAETLTLALADPFGESATASVLASAPPLSIVTPGDVVTPYGTAVALGGLGLSDPAFGPSEWVSVTLSDPAGVLSAPSLAGSGVTIGQTGALLTLSGSLAAVNSELAAVTYTETLSSYTLAITAADAGGNLATGSLATSDAALTGLDSIASNILSATLALNANTTFDSYLATELYPSIFTEFEQSPLLPALGATLSNFSAASFTSALKLDESILSAGYSGKAAPSAAEWDQLLTQQFAATGVSYSSAALGTVASDLTQIYSGLAAGQSSASLSGLVQNIETILSGTSSSAMRVAHPMLAMAAPAGGPGGGSGLGGVLVNLGNALLEFNGILSAQDPGSAIAAAVSGIVDIGLTGVSVAGLNGSPALGALSGLAGLINSSAQLGNDLANPDVIPNGQLQGDAVNVVLSYSEIVASLIAPEVGAAINLGLFAGNLFSIVATNLLNQFTKDVQAGKYDKQLQQLINGLRQIGNGINGYNNSNGRGDVHLQTFSGQLYDFQAAGEFTLAKSTQSGNSFDIRARLQPWYQSASVSVMTQIAAAMGSDRITFGLGRDALVYVDGVASTISQSNPIVQLNGGYVVQTSANTYALIWNTGEVAQVSNDGSYLSIDVSLGPKDGANSVQGLLGPDNGTANDFQLPDGTVLSQPLTTTELYTTFANAWRIDQAGSLFDYAAGQSTASFTDSNFPADAIQLASLPANLVAQAEALVAAAGITNPAQAQAAALDYLATGNLAFVSTDGAPSGTLITATSVASSGLTVAEGIFAPQSSVVAAASGTTAVPLEIYLTGTLATAETIHYGVIAPDGGELGLVAFGGTLPGGEVTIAAGQSTAQVTLDLPAGILGSLASQNLMVTISATDSTPVFAPTATVEIVNAAPEPGPAAAPELVNLSGTGLLVQDAVGYVLDLGTLVTGESLNPAVLGLANNTTAGSDLLSGSFGSAIGGGFSLATAALGTIAAGGTVAGLTLSALTGTAGVNQEVLFLYPTDSNGSGYSAATAPIAITIEDTVVNPAAAGFAQGTVINLGTIHAGQSIATALTIANSAATPAAGLDAGIAGVSGAATGTGSVTDLKAGVSDTHSLVLGLEAGTAGTESGYVTLSLDSEVSGGIAALPDATFSLSATVLNYATAALEAGGHAVVNGTLDLGTVGSATVIDLTVANTAIGPADLLKGSFALSGSSDFTASGFGAFSGLAAGNSLATYAVTLTPLASGQVSETITLDPTGYESSGYAGALAAQTLVIAADVSTGRAGSPVLTAPASVSLAAGTAKTISGITLTENPASQGETFSVIITDRYGALAASGAGVSGDNTHTLTLSGTLAAVNAALKTLTDTDLTAGSDTITLTATDSLGEKAAPATIAVSNAGTVSGGVVVQSGQTANNLTLSQGGTVLLSTGSAADNTTIGKNGMASALPGSTMDNTTLNSGGVQAVAGAAIDTKINQGGRQIVGLGGYSNYTTIGSGGTEYVLLGATAFNSTIDGGGTLVVGAAGKLGGGLSFAGSDAVLSLAGTVMPSAIISGFDLGGSSGDEMVLTGFRYAAGHDTATLGPQNVLTLDLNGKVEKLTLNSAQNYAGHSFAVTTNSADQVVVIDPMTGSSEMGFLSPPPQAAPSLPANDLAPLFGPDAWSGTSLSAPLLPLLLHPAKLDQAGSPALGALVGFAPDTATLSAALPPVAKLAMHG